MIPFSELTIKDWKIRGIENVSYFLISGGCAGEKVMVTEEIYDGMNLSQIHEGIQFHSKKEEAGFFENTKLTKVGEKWIAANKQSVLGHCSCGSSFKRKTGNPILDKAEQIRLALKKKSDKPH